MIDWRSVCLQVFAKCPANGRPKTRLQPPLTPAQASALHMQLAGRTLQMLQSIGGAAAELWLDQPSQHPWVEYVRTRLGCAIRLQCEGDLGARMENSLRAGLQDHRYAILVGSDCPVLEVAHIRGAVQALIDGSDAVFIPAIDGGYVLIGLSRLDPTLFCGVSWGTNQVMQQTRDRLLQLDWRWVEDAPLWDVDRPDDLDRLRREGIQLPSLADMITDN